MEAARYDTSFQFLRAFVLLTRSFIIRIHVGEHDVEFMTVISLRFIYRTSRNAYRELVEGINTRNRLYKLRIDWA